MKIKSIWFDGDLIYGRDEEGQVYRQSLLWYPRLLNADDEQRAKYSIGLDGIHWRELDEDISFESFEYKDAIPSPLQSFFLKHREINISEFANSMGINATLLRNYINGFKTPSQERSDAILSHLHKMGKEYMECSFSE
mgnify:CR=1 FL=1